MSLIGSEGYVRERLAALQEAGVTTLNVAPIAGDPRGPLKLIEKIKELAAGAAPAGSRADPLSERSAVAGVMRGQSRARSRAGRHPRAGAAAWPRRCPRSRGGGRPRHRPVNVRYLTGLASSNAACWSPPTGERRAGHRLPLRGDGRGAVCPDLEVLEAGRDVAGALLAPAGPAQGRGRGRTTMHGRAAPATGRRAAEPVPVGGLVEAADGQGRGGDRAARRACAITDQAFAEVAAARPRPGSPSGRSPVALERRMVELGADRPAFDSIVASGPNGADPAPLARRTGRSSDGRPGHHGLRRTATAATTPT